MSIIFVTTSLISGMCSWENLGGVTTWASRNNWRANDVKLVFRHYQRNKYKKPTGFRLTICFVCGPWHKKESYS